MIGEQDRQLRLLAKSAEEFAKKELLPEREENDHYPFGPFFAPVVEKAHELGLLHAALPQDMEGMGGILPFCVILQAISQHDASMAGILFANALGQKIILEAGEKGLLKRLSVQAGNAPGSLLAVPAMDNPREIRNLAQAKRRGRGWVLSGEVNYVVLANLAPNALIPASLSKEEGFGWFLVDLKEEGVEVSEPVFSLGLHACPAADVKLEAVKARALGEPGKGQDILDKAMDPMMIALAAMETGIMQGSFKDAADYAKQRRQGGRKIAQWSELQTILSSMAVSCQVSESSVERAAMAADAGVKGWQHQARAAAVFAADSAVQVTTDGIQVLGGVGYMKDYPQEKRFRDAQHTMAFLGMQPMKKLFFLKKLLRLK